MPSRIRSLLGLVVLVSTVPVAGCKDDSPAPAVQATPESGAKATVPSTSDRAALRAPGGNAARVDPAQMKDYRLEGCYFGSQSLLQARAAYVASLGGAEPSAQKLPGFGLPETPEASARPAREGKAEGTPESRREARGILGGGLPRGLAGGRAPFERYARACTVAAGLKDPAMGDVDAALAAFAPVALDVAKQLTAAQTYYSKEEYKKDEFAKGKELHKKLVAGFEKLDPLSAKLGSAMASWRAEHPVDTSKLEGEGHKAGVLAYEDARALMLELVAGKATPEARKPLVDKLEASTAALRKAGEANAADPWVKLLTPSLEGFLKEAQAAQPDALMTAVTAFNGVVESRHRALSRALVAKGQTGRKTDPSPGAAAAPAAAVPAVPAVPAAAAPEKAAE